MAASGHGAPEARPPGAIVLEALAAAAREASQREQEQRMLSYIVHDDHRLFAIAMDWAAQHVRRVKPRSEEARTALRLELVDTFFKYQMIWDVSIDIAKFDNYEEVRDAFDRFRVAVTKAGLHPDAASQIVTEVMEMRRREIQRQIDTWDDPFDEEDQLEPDDMGSSSEGDGGATATAMQIDGTTIEVESRLKRRPYRAASMWPHSYSCLRLRELRGRQPTNPFRSGYSLLHTVKQSENIVVRSGRERGVFDAKYSPQGDILAVACASGDISLHSPTSADCIHTITQAHEFCANVIAWMTNNLFLSVSDDTTIRLWDTRRPTLPVKVFYGHTQWVKNADAIDSTTLVSGGFDGTVRMWNINMDYPENNSVDNVLMNEDGLVRVRYFNIANKLAWCTRESALCLLHDVDLSAHFDAATGQVRRLTPEDCGLDTPSFAKSCTRWFRESQRIVPQRHNTFECVYEDFWNTGHTTNISSDLAQERMLTRRGVNPDQDENLEMTSVFDLTVPVEEHAVPFRVEWAVKDSHHDGYISCPSFGGGGEYIASPYFKFMRLIESPRGIRVNASAERPVIHTIRTAHTDFAVVCAAHPYMPVMASGGLDNRVVWYHPQP